VPINYVDATPSRVRQIVDMGFGGLTRGLHRIVKPTIAAVNGWALADGPELALACDVRLASKRAMFRSFEARRGFHHGDGGITRLVNTCGVGVAMQMVLTAEPIDANRALQWNMITKSCSPRTAYVYGSGRDIGRANPAQLSAGGSISQGDNPGRHWQAPG
jgi:enoyl-CoA hydratase/carnithine racemase